MEAKQEEEEEEASGLLSLAVDTTSRHEVKQLYLKVEHWFKYEEQKGRVEFTISTWCNV